MIVQNMIGLPPGATQTFPRSTGMPRVRETSAAMASRKLRQPQGRHVMGVAIAQRLNAGLGDVGRRVEVRLADLEMDDLPTFGLQGTGTREHVERALRPDA